MFPTAVPHLLARDKGDHSSCTMPYMPTKRPPIKMPFLTGFYKVKGERV